METAYGLNLREAKNCSPEIIYFTQLHHALELLKVHILSTNPLAQRCNAVTKPHQWITILQISDAEIKDT